MAKCVFKKEFEVMNDLKLKTLWTIFIGKSLATLELEGFAGSDILVGLRELEFESFIFFNGQKMVVTTKGFKFIRGNPRVFDLHKFSKDNWIKPLVEMRSSRLQLDSVYLPDINFDD